MCSFFFFFNDTATTEIYTLSLHDALPIYAVPTQGLRFSAVGVRSESSAAGRRRRSRARRPARRRRPPLPDRKSTRLNSSHANISYAVFCLKKKKNTTYQTSYMYMHAMYDK